MRIVVAGWPGAGKTTSCAPEQARAAGIPASAVRHTDDLIEPLSDWSAASAEVSTWLRAPGPWVVEGVACPRAIRKALEAHPDERPCDRLVICRQPLKDLNNRQRGMGKGVDTVLAEILPRLEALGVEIVYWTAR
jgi:broad-specificity NMP kinase